MRVQALIGGTGLTTEIIIPGPTNLAYVFIILIVFNDQRVKIGIFRSGSSSTPTSNTTLGLPTGCFSSRRPPPLLAFSCSWTSPLGVWDIICGSSVPSGSLTRCSRCNLAFASLPISLLVVRSEQRSFGFWLWPSGRMGSVFAGQFMVLVSVSGEGSLQGGDSPYGEGGAAGFRQDGRGDWEEGW